MPSLDAIGCLAVMRTTCAFVPQAHLAGKTRRTDGISIGMYAIFSAGVLLWLIYGILIGAWPMIVANVVTLLLAVFIVAPRLRHGRRPK